MIDSIADSMKDELESSAVDSVGLSKFYSLEKK